MNEEIKKLCPDIPDDWVYFKDVDFSDQSILQYHIDTRDFHVLLSKKKHENDKSSHVKVNLDFASLKRKPERYIFQQDELKQLIERYYIESGGNRDWRMFYLSGSGAEYTEGWQLKYLRIFRVETGLIVCNSHGYCLQKSILKNPVAKPY